MAIGRRKHVRKTKKFNVVRMHKQRKQREPKTPKRFNAFKKNYENAVASGQMDRSRKFERELEDISKYLNKDGTPSKRALRSESARKDFAEKVKEFNRAHRKWGKEYFKEVGVEQEILKTRRASSHTQNELEKMKKSGVKGGRNLSEIALNISEQYRKMVDLFALDSFEKLREQLNIGSPVVERIANSGLSLEDADKYFKDFLDAKKSIPKEAQKLAGEDELNSAIADLIKLAGKDNVKDALELYMLSSGNMRERALNIAVYHAEHNSKKSLMDFYDDIMNESDNPNDESSWKQFL